MIKKFCYTLIAILLLSLICGCTSNTPDSLKFYVLSREYINEGMSDNKIVSTAKEHGRFVFDGSDISGYNWQSHTITLNEDSVPTIGTVTAEKGGSALFKVDDSYAFVLVLKNELVYVGGFNNGTKSPDIPLQPYIKDETRYSFSIQFDSKYSSTSDNRANTKLYNFLEYQGLLTTK